VRRLRTIAVTAAVAAIAEIMIENDRSNSRNVDSSRIGARRILDENNRMERDRRALSEDEGSGREGDDDEVSSVYTNVSAEYGRKLNLMDDKSIYILLVLSLDSVEKQYGNKRLDEWAHVVEEDVDIHCFPEYAFNFVIDNGNSCIYLVDDCKLYSGNAIRLGGAGGGSSSRKIDLQAGTRIVGFEEDTFNSSTDWDLVLARLAKGLPKYLKRPGTAGKNGAINGSGNAFYDLKSGTISSINSRRVSRQLIKKRVVNLGPIPPPDRQGYGPPLPFEMLPPPLPINPPIPPLPINPPIPAEKYPHWLKVGLSQASPVGDHLAFETPVQNRELPLGNLPVHTLSTGQFLNLFSEMAPVWEYIPSSTNLTIVKAYKHVLEKWANDKDDVVAQRQVTIFCRVVFSPIRMDDGKSMQSRMAITRICKLILNNEWDKITVGLYVMRQRHGVRPPLSEEKRNIAIGKRVTKEMLKGNLSKGYSLLVNEGTLQSSHETHDFLRKLIPTGKSIDPLPDILKERQDLVEERNMQMDDDDDPVIMAAFERLLVDEGIEVVTITEAQVLKAVNALKMSTACFDGGKMEFFKYVIFYGNNLSDDSSVILTLLTSFLNYTCERKVHTDTLKFLNTSRLFAIRSGKPELNKMRPIYQQNSLMKLLMKAVHSEYAVVARSSYDGLQTEGMRGGTEKVVHLVETYIEKNPGADVVQLDFINAFSLVNRETLAHILEKSSSQLAKTLVGVTLAPVTQAVWGDSDEGPQVFATETGTSIGSIFGTTLFAQSLQPHLEFSKKLLEDEAKFEALRSNSEVVMPLVVAFVDDVTLAGDARGLIKAIKHFKSPKIREQTGLFTNEKKEKVLLGLRDDYDSALAAVELYHGAGVPYMNIYIHPDNIPDDCPILKKSTEERYTLLCLGTPIGSTAAKALFLGEKIKQLSEEAKKLSLYQNSQFQAHLFLHCFCNKTQYLLRTMPLGGVLKTFLHLEEDLKKIIFAAGLLKMHPDKLAGNTWEQAMLHRGDGGLGIGKNLTIASAAYLASVIESLPFSEPHFPGLTERMKTLSNQPDTGNFSLREIHFLEAIKTLNKNSGEVDLYTSMKLFDPEFIKQEAEKMTKDPHLSNARNPTLQLILCNGVRKYALNTLLKKLKPMEAHRLAAASNADTGVNRILRALPSLHDHRNRINDEPFIIGIFNLLGQPLCGVDAPFGSADKSCSKCDFKLGTHPNAHFSTKNCLAMKTGFHDLMRDQIMGLFRSLHLNCNSEQSLLGRKDSDILVTSEVEGLTPHLQTGIDLTFPHCSDAYFPGKDPVAVYHKHPQDIVNLAHKSKMKPDTLNRMALAHTNFRPFVMGLHGEIHTLSTALLRSIAEEVAKNGFWKSKAKDLLRFMLTAISVQHFRAKSELLIRTMKVNNRKAVSKIKNLTNGGIVEIFEAYKEQIGATKMNEPYQVLTLPNLRRLAG